MESEAVKRPKRRAIPVAIKRAVCERHNYCCPPCGARVHWKPRQNTHFDHNPALALRDVRADGTDYKPPQHSIKHIDPLCPKCHHAKTHGTGATTAGTDVGKIKKERKRAKALALIALRKPGALERLKQAFSAPRGFVYRWPPKGSRIMKGSRR